MPARYDLTAAAKEDVRGIWRYTAEQWGESQADHYLGTLEAMFERIADGTALSRQFLATYPQLRVTRCEHHYIFFLFPEGRRPIIIAVLHKRMDLLARITHRLPV